MNMMYFFGEFECYISENNRWKRASLEWFLNSLRYTKHIYIYVFVDVERFTHSLYGHISLEIDLLYSEMGARRTAKCNCWVVRFEV